MSLFCLMTFLNQILLSIDFLKTLLFVEALAFEFLMI